MAYMMCGMEFIETPTFTRLLTALLTDDEYAGLQNEKDDLTDRETALLREFVKEL